MLMKIFEQDTFFYAILAVLYGSMILVSTEVIDYFQEKDHQKQIQQLQEIEKNVEEWFPKIRETLLQCQKIKENCPLIFEED